MKDRTFRIFVLALAMLFIAIYSVKADTLTKRWRDQTLTADVTVKSLNEKTTLDTAYSLVKDKHKTYSEKFFSQKGEFSCQNIWRYKKDAIHLHSQYRGIDRDCGVEQW